jgi:hypothetical protein
LRAVTAETPIVVASSDTTRSRASSFRPNCITLPF